MKNRIRNIILILFVIIIFAGTVIFIFRKKIVAHFIPNIEQIGEIHIKVKNDTTYVSSKLAVKNNSFLKIEIDSIKYKVSLFEKEYLNNQKFIGLVLPKYGTDTIDFSLKIPYVKIIKDLNVERKKGDSASYSINISLQYSTVFGKVEFPINKSAKIKIPQPPEINIVDIKYKKISFKSILADARIEVINYSDVILSIKDISYTMSIIERGNLKGNLKNPINIKPNGSTFINLPIEINLNNVGKTIFEVIINKDNYNYTLTLNAILESSYPFKESFHIDLTKNGQMELKK